MDAGPSDRCQAYPRIAAILISSALDLAIQAREDLGDVDRWIIFASISVRFYEREEVKRLSTEALASLPDGAFALQGVNAFSVAESTGIPRETVRRKLRSLVEDGWISQRGATFFLSRQGVMRARRFRGKLIRFAQRAEEALATLAPAVGA